MSVFGEPRPPIIIMLLLVVVTSILVCMFFIWGIAFFGLLTFGTHTFIVWVDPTIPDTIAWSGSGGIVAFMWAGGAYCRCKLALM